MTSSSEKKARTAKGDRNSPKKQQNLQQWSREFPDLAVPPYLSYSMGKESNIKARINKDAYKISDI